jgi:hypothetical protein
MIGGEVILIDSGRYILQQLLLEGLGDNFTGSLAHNTVYVDDHEMGSVPKVTRVRVCEPGAILSKRTGRYA